MPFKDLREFIAKQEKAGEAVRIEGELVKSPALPNVFSLR